MFEDGRKSTTSLARDLLRQADRLVDRYRTGQLSERETRRLYDQALATFRTKAAENFLLRVDNSRFFRDPVPQLDSDASPVSQSDG